MCETELELWRGRCSPSQIAKPFQIVALVEPRLWVSLATVADVSYAISDGGIVISEL